MKQERTESFGSPLDEVLENIPQEEPPEGLAERCMDAIDAAAAQQPSHPTWWAPVRNVVAFAAGLLLVVGIYQFAQPRMKLSEPEAPREAVSPSVERPIGPGSGYGGTMAESDYAAEVPDADEEPGMVFEEEAAPEMMEPMAPPASGGLADAPRLPDRAQGIEAQEMRGDAADVLRRAQGMPATEQPGEPYVEDPWRDFSGRRQVITQKEMDVEVGDVEEAYDQARSIVGKHGGFIATDRIQVSETEQDVANLTIRLPVDGFESAITDLRQLGEVTRLVGESVDVTQQYYERGADVRQLADREQWLIDRMENARTEQQRRQLKQQIDQLRRELQQEKELLTRLAEQTHWPVLELRLLERGGPGDFLSRMLEASANALAWVGATAIIWVPLVVLLTLFWRRLVPKAPTK